MPMGYNSTPFISYHCINVKGIDLYEDAWGFNTEFSDIIKFMGKDYHEPRRTLITSLIERIRKDDHKN
jgi:hypothetical protein